MKKFILAMSAVAALAASPALARDNTHVSIGFGFYSPAPVYYEPVAYYPPARPIYYAPRPYYQFGYYEKPRRHHHGRGHGWGHERRYESAWNDRDNYRGGYDRDDRGRGGDWHR